MRLRPRPAERLTADDVADFTARLEQLGPARAAVDPELRQALADLEETVDAVMWVLASEPRLHALPDP